MKIPPSSPSFVSRLVLEDEGLLLSILSFSEASTTRKHFIFLNRHFCELLTSDDSFRWRLERLHAENGIYFPANGTTTASAGGLLRNSNNPQGSAAVGNASPPSSSSWKSLYLENLSRRFLWVGDDTATGPHPRAPQNSSDAERSEAGVGNEDPRNRKNKIAVCARLKPRAAAADRKGRRQEQEQEQLGGQQMDGASPRGRVVTLPLHQRLSLIRMGGKLNSNREALRVLQLQGGWFAGQREEEEEQKKKGKTSAASGEEQQESSPGGTEEGDENAARLPIVPPSLSGGVHSIDHENGRLVVVDPTKGLREFAFDGVLPDRSTQEHAYDRCARNLVADFINGSNATCLAYGQTGSGKTYTMFGPNDDPWLLSLPPERQQSTGDRKWGIIPQACCEVFDAIEYRRDKLNFGIEATVSMSYVEIYGDKVSDLLRERSPCGHSQVAAQRYVLDGSAEMEVSTFSDAMDLLRKGEESKRTASTAMNERSSRAHTILVLTLKQQKVDRQHQPNPSNRCITSRLFLVDLGGSENIKKSRASGNQERTEEAVNINLGLLALKKCAEALNSAGRNKRLGRKTYVPYADSKLTMILSSGLGGDGRTCVVVCANQDPDHYRETLDTVAFGRSIGSVSKKRGGRGRERALLRSLLEQIDRGIAECGERIREDERWVTKEERIRDGYGGIETRKTTVLVGAEHHRLELERMLTRRAELTGSAIDEDLDGGIVGFGNVHEYISKTQ